MLIIEPCMKKYGVLCSHKHYKILSRRVNLQILVLSSFTIIVLFHSYHVVSAMLLYTPCTQ